MDAKSWVHKGIRVQRTGLKGEYDVFLGPVWIGIIKRVEPKCYRAQFRGKHPPWFIDYVSYHKARRLAVDALVNRYITDCRVHK